jgi:transposase-like protein
MPKVKKENEIKPLRVKRIFSEELKRKIVKELESGTTRLCDLCRAYSVSGQTIYNWVDKYSLYLKRGEQVVVESKSETQRVLELSKRTAELEQLVGRKQIAIEYLERLIEMANKELGVDLKKNFAPKL